MIARGLIIASMAWMAFAGAANAQDHEDLPPRNPTEAALAAAVHESPARRPFEAAFMTSTVYFRVEAETYAALMQAKAEGRTSMDGIPIQFWAVEPQPGVRTLAVYLSEEGFNRDHAGHHWISLPGRNVLMFARANGVGVWVTAANSDVRGAGDAVTWTMADIDVILARNPAPQAAPKP